jgi:hypothetical protein
VAHQAIHTIQHQTINNNRGQCIHNVRVAGRPQGGVTQLHERERGVSATGDVQPWPHSSTLIIHDHCQRTRLPAPLCTAGRWRPAWTVLAVQAPSIRQYSPPSPPAPLPVYLHLRPEHHSRGGAASRVCDRSFLMEHKSWVHEHHSKQGAAGRERDRAPFVSSNQSPRASPPQRTAEEVQRAGGVTGHTEWGHSPSRVSRCVEHLSSTSSRDP